MDMEIISSYSRAQAIEDGVLVDASIMAREAGFKFPVAITDTVWALYVKAPDGIFDQDEKGRLWDILNVLRYEIARRKNEEENDIILFTVLVKNDNSRPRPFKLKAICGPGDDPRPVITIMLPDED